MNCPENDAFASAFGAALAVVPSGDAAQLEMLGVASDEARALRALKQSDEVAYDEALRRRASEHERDRAQLKDRVSAACTYLQTVKDTLDEQARQPVGGALRLRARRARHTAARTTALSSQPGPGALRCA
jgi:hypothetical protein